VTNNALVALALLGIGVSYLMSKKTKASFVQPDGAAEIKVAQSNGWRYFTDGTAISPEGLYYFQGSQVWAPAGNDFGIINPAAGWDQ
jgi:hypothetical protein